MLTPVDQPLDKLDDLKPDEMYVGLDSHFPKLTYDFYFQAIT